MKYLILVHSDTWSPETELNEEMIRAGVHVASEGLADPSLARSVSVRDGELVVSHGRHAGAGRHLTGFYLIDCPGGDEAVAWAARVPDAARHAVEVRPVLDMSGSEF